MLPHHQQIESVLQEIIDGIIALPTAAEWLEISYQQLLQLLHDRNIDPPYSIEDFRKDLAAPNPYHSERGESLARRRSRRQPS